MPDITTENTKKLISSCDFLDEATRNTWASKVENLGTDGLQIVYKKFKDAKTKVENIYISIALRNDPTGGELMKEALNVLKNVI